MTESLRQSLVGRTGVGVRVAVVDSGLDPEWRDERFEPGIAMARRERPFVVDPTPDAADRQGHGTACAELVLRLAPGARIVPVRIFGDSLETSPQVAAAGIRWAARHGARVIHLSFGTVEHKALPVLHAACREARRAGAILVAAADLATRVAIPAAFEDVIGVEPLPDDGRVSAGLEFFWVPDECNEIRAPGRWKIRGLGNEWTEIWGSSFTAPQITAWIARCLEAEPRLDLVGVRQRLEALASGVLSGEVASASPACHHS